MSSRLVTDNGEPGSRGSNRGRAAESTRLGNARRPADLWHSRGTVSSANLFPVEVLVPQPRTAWRRRRGARALRLRCDPQSSSSELLRDLVSRMRARQALHRLGDDLARRHAADVEVAARPLHATHRADSKQTLLVGRWAVATTEYGHRTGSERLTCELDETGALTATSHRVQAGHIPVGPTGHSTSFLQPLGTGREDRLAFMVVTPPTAIEGTRA
jgi:hypothetical protein